MAYHRLTVLPHGTTTSLPAGSRLTDLEYELHEVLISFGCRAGVCGACLVEVVDGSTSLGPMQGKEREFLEALTGMGLTRATSTPLQGAGSGARAGR